MILIFSAQATELTLEDRITERIKAYQRQLTALQAAERDATGGIETVLTGWWPPGRERWEGRR